MPFGGMLTVGILAGGQVGGSILGGLLGGRAANEQAAAALNGSNQANQILYNQDQLNRSTLAPYTNLGGQSANALSFMLGIGPQPGSQQAPQPTSLSQEFVDKGNRAKFLQEWLDGKNPIAANGQPMPPPGNAVTRAKIEAEIASLQREVQTQQEIVDNQNKSSQNYNQQDPSQYGSLMKDFTLKDFQEDPGYNFRLQEGAKALDRSAAAKGGLFSGGTLKALTQYNQDFSSNEFNNAFNRFQANRQTKYGMLSGTTQIGQTSAAQDASLGTNIAGQVAQNTENGITGAANARASSYANWANSINQGINGITNIFANRNAINSGNGYGNNGGGGGGYYSTPPFIPNSGSTRTGNGVFN
jgi:hypothetical protein